MFITEINFYFHCFFFLLDPPSNCFLETIFVHKVNRSINPQQRCQMFFLPLNVLLFLDNLRARRKPIGFEVTQ
jgi:hypothetical protein